MNADEVEAAIGFSSRLESRAASRVFVEKPKHPIQSQWCLGGVLLRDAEGERVRGLQYATQRHAHKHEVTCGN